MYTTTRSILRFIWRAFITAVPVLAVLIVLYVIADPFKVVRHHDNYFPANVRAHVGINKGMVSLNNYRNRVADGYHYNAFIFGSSVSCTYRAAAWEELLRQDGCMDASAYHFDSSSESLEAMRNKVRWLDRNGADLKYALVILDPLIMHNEQSDQPYSIDPPEYHPNPWHWLKYHYTFFRASVNFDFLKSWIPGCVYDQPLHIGDNIVFERQPIVYDPIRNEESLPAWDDSVRQYPAPFYAAHLLVPFPDKAVPANPAIHGSRQEAITDIADIFHRHNTAYKIIVSPNRRRRTLHPSDLEKLQKAFGADNVYDFTASMAHYLSVDSMQYDNTHYRAPFATLLLNKAYGK